MVIVSFRSISNNYAHYIPQSWATVLLEAPKSRCFHLVSTNQKSKWPIRTVKRDLHIEISFETKFYIFMNFFTIYNGRDKFVNLIFSNPSNKTIFYLSEKIVKKFKKM